MLLCAVSYTALGQIVTITDANLKNTLLHTNCAQLTNPTWLTDVDANNDGEIQVTEAANVLKLNISTNEFNAAGNINNLIGLELFPNLTELNCKGNSIANLNASVFPNLTKLDCSYNQLTQLNVNGLTQLSELNCSKNQLAQLNIGNLSSLRILYCIYNNLTQIDLSNLTALENVQADVNQLNNVVLANNTALKFLYVQGNSLTHLDIQSAPNINTLSLYGNNLSSLNFSGLNYLRSVDVSSNFFTEIDLSQAPLLNYLFCGNNPNLTSINVRNNYLSWGDSDLLDFPFRFEDLPNLSNICMDDGEQNNLINTNYNLSGNVHIFGGENCDVPLQISAAATANFNLDGAIDLYPNPSDNTINISTRSNVMVQSVNIFNTLGQSVKSDTLGNLSKISTIDIANLKTGTYFIEIFTDSGKTTRKFIKL
jgi:Leucine-rich repeat (LRR) protein